METQHGAGGGIAARFMTPKGQRIAWYLYDFGNSAYASVVLLAIYSAYFKQSVVGGAEGSRLWGLSVGAGMLVVALISPILGTLADHFSIKRRLLAIFTLMSCGFTGMLFFVQKGDLVTGILFFIMAEVGYRAAQVFYDAMLPEVAEKRSYARVSGIGWAVGSFGGILCLLIVLPLVVSIGGTFIVRVAMVITAVYFLIFALPLLLFVREKGQPQPLPPGSNVFLLGFKRLYETFRKARQHKEYLKFMLSFIVYNDGVMIALNFAAIIGAVLYGFKQEQLIILIILVGLANTAGAWFFGELSHRMSARSSILAALVLMIATVFWLQGNEDGQMFFVIASVAGFAMAGLQAVSRTMVAKLAPAGQAAEFFGLFAVAGRSSSVIGPALFGWVAAEGAIAYANSGMDALAAEQAGMRSAIYVIIAFLVVGGALLLTVREESVPEAEPVAGNA